MSEGLIWLTEAEVAELVDLGDAIDAIGDRLAEEARGEAEGIPKALGTWAPRHSVHALGAVSAASKTACFKTWINTPAGAAAILTLFDAAEGRVLAVIEAATVGFLRTAAISGVATRHLAAANATSMGIIGTGAQALQQVAAVLAVRPLQSVQIYSPTKEHRVAFASRVRDELGLEANAVDSLDAAIDGQPIVTVITRAHEPFVAASLFAPGAHLNAAGAILPANAELLPDVLQASSLTVVDSIANARAASRELRDYDNWPAVVPLHAVVAGSVTRPVAPTLTVFKGIGMGLSDLAVATLTYERAREQGRGMHIPKAVPVTPRWTTART